MRAPRRLRTNPARKRALESPQSETGAAPPLDGKMFCQTCAAGTGGRKPFWGPAVGDCVRELADVRVCCDERALRSQLPAATSTSAAAPTGATLTIRTSTRAET